MFDFSRIGLPCVVEAHGKKWLAVYQIHSDSPAGDESSFYIACEADQIMPATLSMICVPRDPADVDMRKKAREKRTSK